MPRRDARVKIPRSAFSLKNNFSGGFCIKICDKVDSSAALGDSPVLSIDDAIGNRSVVCGIRPPSRLSNKLIWPGDLQQFVDDGFKILSSIR